MPVTTSYKNTILNMLTGKTQSVSAGGSVYIGLSSTAPNADGSGITEPSGNGYARVLIGYYNQSYSQLFGAAANGAISNTKDIFFPESRGAWLSGTPLTHFVLYKNATGIGTSDVIGFGRLEKDGVATPVLVTAAEEIVLIRAGEATLTVGDASAGNGLTNNFKHNILNLLVGKNTSMSIGSVYLGLSSTEPQPNGSGITEPSGNGYARVLIGYYNQSYSQLFGAPSNGGISNVKDIFFPESKGHWLEGAPLTHFVLYSSASSTSASYVIGYGQLKKNGVIYPVSISKPEQVVLFRAGDITITCDEN